MTLIYFLIYLTITALILSSGILNKVRIVPIVPLGYIKVTTFDRALCKAYVELIHPITKSVVSLHIEGMNNCIPIWNQVATPYPKEPHLMSNFTQG